VQTLAQPRPAPGAQKVPKGGAIVHGEKLCARFPYPDFVTAPEVGQVFVDETFGGYQIDSVAFVGDCWECEVSKV
jgi:hypothetical protein